MNEMPKVLSRIEVASPCGVAWSSMKGDDQVRLRKQCNQHVFDLEAMTFAEIAQMMYAKEGKACVRFYRRFDGTILTTDGPEGLAARVRKRAFKMVLAAAGFLSLITFGLLTFAATSAVAGGARPMPEFRNRSCGTR